MPHFRQQALSTGSCSGRVYSVGIGACAAGSGYELQVSVDGAERRHAVVYAAPAPAPLQQPYSGCVLVRGNALDDRMLVLTPGGLFLLTPSAPEAPSFRVQGCLVCSHALDVRWHPLSADHFGALVREPKAGGSGEGHRSSSSSSSSSALLSFCAHLGMAPFRTDEWRLPPSAAPRVAFAYGVPCSTAAVDEGGGEGAAAAARYSRVWECLSAFVLDRDGALGVLSPAVPSGLVVTSGLWQALREDAQQRGAEWRVEERRLAAQSQCAQWLEGAWAAVGGAAHQYRGCRATAAFAGRFPPPAFQGPIPIYPAALWAGAELVDLCVLPTGPAPAVLCLAGDSRVAVCRGWEGISPAWAAPSAAAEAAAGRGAGGTAADAPCVACPLLHNRPPAPSVATRKSEARLRRMAMGSPLARALLLRSLQQPAEPSSGAERGVLSQQLPAELSSEELGTPWLWLLAAHTVRSDGACAQRAWAPCFTPAGPLRPSTVLLCSRLGGLLALRVDGLEEGLSCDEASAKRIKHTLTLSLRPLGVLAGGGSVTCGGTVGRRIRSGSGPGARDVWDYPIVSYGAPLPLPEALLLQARSGGSGAAAGSSACTAVTPGPPRLSLPRRSADLQWDRDPLVVGAGSGAKGARGSDAAGQPTGLSLSHKECLRGIKYWTTAAEELAGVEGAAAAAAAAPAAAAPAAAAALHHAIVTAASKACNVVAQRAVELLTLAEALKDDQGALHARCQDTVQRAHAVEVRVHSFAERAQGWEARVEQVGRKTRGLLDSARALVQRVTAGLGGQEYLQSVAEEQELVGLLRDLRVLQAQILAAPLP